MSGSMPKLLTRRQARLAATGLAGVRAGIGVVALAAPKLVMRPWVGAGLGEESGARLLGRSLGARDLALGLGAILAERHDAAVRGWIEAGGLADAGDLAATCVSFKALPKTTRWAVLALIAGAVVAGAVIAPCVDRDD